MEVWKIIIPGLAEDSPELLNKIFNYLKKHGTEN
jgi:hypothetical protein